MASPRKMKAVVSEITCFSDTVRRIRLIPEKFCPEFKPGQFLHLAVDPYDPSYSWPESRVFSIANSPGRRDHLDLIISCKGQYTRRVFGLKTGDTVWIRLPYGIFNFEEAGERKIVLLAGGTGISPFISFLQDNIDRQKDPEIILYYGIREPKLLIIGELLQECRQHFSRFSPRIFVEKADDTDVPLNFRQGILPVAEIAGECTGLENPLFFLSGPPAMIGSFEKELLAKGFPTEDIKYDAWE